MAQPKKKISRKKKVAKKRTRRSPGTTTDKDAESRAQYQRKYRERRRTLAELREIEVPHYPSEMSETVDPVGRALDEVLWRKLQWWLLKDPKAKLDLELCEMARKRAEDKQEGQRKEADGKKQSMPGGASVSPLSVAMNSVYSGTGEDINILQSTIPDR